MMTARTLIVLAMAGTMSFPALAQDAMSADTMSCVDFTAMDSAGQMQAMAGMEMAAEGDMASEGTMAAEGDMAAEGTMAEGDMASEEGMAAEGDITAAVTAYCAEHPDMMVGDAMEELMAHE